MHIRKIVLADDEGTQLKILSTLIKKITPETEVALCSDGNEAWQAIREGDVELLITDIRMPSMDGMELIRLVSEGYPRISIVLISAYQEFDYAKSAIACGVSEYLLKPFRVEDIRRLITKMEIKIGALREENERSLDYEALRRKNHRDAQQRILLSIMYRFPLSQKAISPPGPDTINALDKALAESLSGPGLLAVLRWKIRMDSHPSCHALSHHQQELLEGHIHRAIPAVISIPLENPLNISEHRLALLLSGYTAARCQACLEAVISLCKSDGIVFHAGISMEQENLLSTLGAALSQAEDALSYSFYYSGQTMVFRLPDSGLGDDLPMISLSGFEKDIRRAIHTGNLSQFRQSLDSLERELSQKPLKAPGKVRHGISSLVVSVIKDLDGMISRKEYDSILNETYRLYSSCDSLEELFSISLSLLERTAAYFTQESGQYDTMEDVIAWLKKHFMEEISLQQLSDRVHFSASYLSAQILKKTGMSYSSYLGYLRTEKARQLLLETDMKVMDIASSCGYRDSSYFNRIFHRKYGTSPEQYRKAHKKC